MCYKKISIKSFKGVSRMFQWSFVLQFCSCMNLIAATRAEGGLVSDGLGKALGEIQSSLELV